jgi:hypothetical protein
LEKRRVFSPTIWRRVVWYFTDTLMLAPSSHGLSLDLEDGSTFLRNDCQCLLNYTTSHHLRGTALCIHFVLLSYLFIFLFSYLFPSCIQISFNLNFSSNNIGWHCQVTESDCSRVTDRWPELLDPLMQLPTTLHSYKHFSIHSYASTAITWYRLPTEDFLLSLVYLTVPVPQLLASSNNSSQFTTRTQWSYNSRTVNMTLNLKLKLTLRPKVTRPVRLGEGPL